MGIEMPEDVLCTILHLSGPCPLRLSHVSRYWRCVSFRDPRLWSSIRLTLNTSHPLLALWLSLSAAQPLTIEIKADVFQSLPLSSQYPSTHSNFQSLAREARRWISLSLFLPSPSPLLDVLLSQPTPRLEELHLELGNWSDQEGDSVNTLLSTSPSVRRFRWNNRTSWSTFDKPNEPSSAVSRLQANWASMNVIELEAWITISDLLAIFTDCVSLQSIQLSNLAEDVMSLSTVPIPAADSPVALDLITLPNLQAISIYQLTIGPALRTLFDSLICPSLKDFSYACGFVRHDTWPQSSFTSFLSRSSDPPLSSLSLELTGITETQLIQTLEQISSTLRELEVYDARGDICVSEKLLKRIACQSFRQAHVGSAPVLRTNCTALCPTLCALKLVNVVSCHESIINHVMQSRAPPSIGKQSCCSCEHLLDVEIS